MTGPDDKRIVRSTLRCLVEDLAQELRSDEVRVAVRTLVDDIRRLSRLREVPGLPELPEEP